MASVKRRGDGWQVRWRDRVGTDAEGRAMWRPRSQQCPTKRAADALRREIEEAASMGRNWTPAREAACIDLRDGFTQYLAHLERLQRSRSKFTAVGAAVSRAWEVLGAKEGVPLPASRLDRQLLEDVWELIHHREGLAASTATRRVRELEMWWKWMSQRELAGVPAPRELPDLPRRVPVESVAPTWAEVDAVIRELTRDGWTPPAKAAWISRCTGLRTSAAVALRWDHVDLQRRLMHIPPGHRGTKRGPERQGWTAPLPSVFVEQLTAWAPGEGEISELQPDEKTRGSVRKVLVSAWEACEARDEVRAIVWRPPGRLRRPTHAFRAAWKAGMAAAGVRWEVRQALVGGSRGTDRVYIDGQRLGLEEAVEKVPALTGDPTH